MLDKYLLPKTEKQLTVIAEWLNERKVTANQVSFAGFAIGMLALPLIANQYYFLGLVAILLNRLCDGVDGNLARLTESSPFGAFIDISLDFVFYQSVVLAFILASPENVFWGGILMLCFTATGTTFLAFSIIAQKHQFTSKDYPQKGIYYATGLAEGSETLIYFILCCLLPTWFVGFSQLFVVLCLITAVSRMWQAYQVFEQADL